MIKEWDRSFWPGRIRTEHNKKGIVHKADGNSVKGAQMRSEVCYII